MLIKNQIYKFVILMFFISILSIVSASAVDVRGNDSGHMDEFSDSNSSNSYFEEYKDEPLFIASRGTFPETIDQEWNNSVSKCWLSISTEKSLVEFDPSVYAIGNAGEFLEVYLSSSYQGKINESKIDEIYLKIGEYCKQEAVINEIPVVFMWTEDAEDMPLLDYGPEILENVKNDPSVIAVYGTMPVIEQESEKRRWIDSLGHSTDGEVRPFSAEFGGPVTGYGVSINGYLFVGMDRDSPEKVNESVIDEIYQAIDKHFEQEVGITGVPVVFRWEKRAVLDEAIVEEESTSDEDENPVIVGNEKTEQDKGANNQLPGFTSILLVVGLVLLAISRK